MQVLGPPSGSESTSVLQPLLYSAAPTHPSHFEVASYNQSDDRANISRSNLQPIAGVPASCKAETPPVVPKGGPSGPTQSAPSKCFTNVLLVVSILAFVGVAVIIALFLIYFTEPTKSRNKTKSM